MAHQNPLYSRKLKLLTAALILTLLLTQTVSAWWGRTAWGYIKDFRIWVWSEIVTAVKTIQDLAEFVRTFGLDGFAMLFYSLFKEMLNTVFISIKFFIETNPCIYAGGVGNACTYPGGLSLMRQTQVVTDLVRTILNIIYPFYVILVLLTGIYIIFMSQDPKSRSKAKDLLAKLIVGMVIVGLSLPIYQFLLNISSALTAYVLAQADAARAGLVCGSNSPTGCMADYLMAGYANLVLIVPALLVAVLTMLIAAIRYTVVILLAIMFPITLFLYFFNPTKSFGVSLLTKTIMWICVPIVQALMVAVTMFALESVTMVPPSYSQALVLGFLPLAGLFGIIVAPLIMMGLMKWIGGAIAMSGMLGLADATTLSDKWKAYGKIAAGGIMMGQKGDALVTAAAYVPWMQEGTSFEKPMIPSFSRRFYQTSADTWAREARSEAGQGLYWGRRPGESRGVSRPVSKAFWHARGTWNIDRTKGMGDMREAGIRVGRELPPQIGMGGIRAPPPSPRGMSPRFLPYGGDEDQYTKISDQLAGRAKKDTEPRLEGWPFLPTDFFMSLEGRGKSLMEADKHLRTSGERLKGVGMTLWALRPPSPFYPVRHMGRILYTGIVEILPPLPIIPGVVNLHDLALWSSRKIAGLGLGQISSRSSWRMQLRKHRKEWDRLGREEERLREKGRDKQADDLRAQRMETGDRVVRIMDEIRYTGGSIRQLTDPNYHRKMKSLLYMKSPSLFAYYEAMSRHQIEIEDEKTKAMRRINRRDYLEHKNLKKDFKEYLEQYLDAMGVSKDKRVRSKYLDEKRDDAEFVDETIRSFILAKRWGVGAKYKHGSWDLEAVDLERQKAFMEEQRRATEKITGMSGKECDFILIDDRGNVTVKRNRALMDGEKEAANKNEKWIMPDGMSTTNLLLHDIKTRDGEIITYTDNLGSRYVHQLKEHFELGGGMQGIGDLNDPQVQIWLDAQGVGFKEKDEHRENVRYRIAQIMDEKIGDRVYRIQEQQPDGSWDVAKYLTKDAKGRETWEYTSYKDAVKKEDEYKKERGRYWEKAQEEYQVRNNMSKRQFEEYKRRIKESNDRHYLSQAEVIDMNNALLPQRIHYYINQGMPVEEARRAAEGETAKNIDDMKIAVCDMEDRLTERLRASGAIGKDEKFAFHGIEVIDNLDNNNITWAKSGRHGTVLVINVGSQAYQDDPEKLVQHLGNADPILHEAGHYMIRDDSDTLTGGTGRDWSDWKLNVRGGRKPTHVVAPPWKWIQFGTEDPQGYKKMWGWFMRGDVDESKYFENLKEIRKYVKDHDVGGIIGDEVNASHTSELLADKVAKENARDNNAYDEAVSMMIGDPTAKGELYKLRESLDANRRLNDDELAKLARLNVLADEINDGNMKNEMQRRVRMVADDARAVSTYDAEAYDYFYGMGGTIFDRVGFKGEKQPEENEGGS